MDENQLSYKVIGIALDIHRHFGPGCLESIYAQALVYDLEEAGLIVRKQVPIPYKYKNLSMTSAFRADIIVNDILLIELKSTIKLEPVHSSQTLTYLRLMGLKLALLINFNEKLLRNGIHRIVNNL
jgi:GxxExxY protein